MAEVKTWKPLELVKVTADYLAGKKVPTPRLDAEVLLCNIMGLQRRVDLYAGFEREISGKELAAYRELIRRRAAREPVSRIMGRRDFMGIEFAITPDVLSPRPETELLVEAAVEAVRPKKPAQPEPGRSDDAFPADDALPAELEKLLDSYGADADSADDVDGIVSRPVEPVSSGRNAAAVAGIPSVRGKKTLPSADGGRSVRVLDLGTGSGCIAVAIAACIPEALVVAVDASPKALGVAKKNANKAGVAARIDFRQGDWFAACRRGEMFDLVLSNPPYLVEGDPDIWPEVSSYDPPVALYGGQDGLDCYRRIVPDASSWLTPGGFIFFEVGAGQSPKVESLLRGRGFEAIASVRDYGGVERIVRGKAPAE